MDDKPKILYMYHAFKNFLLCFVVHFEDDTEKEVFVDSSILLDMAALATVMGTGLGMSPVEFMTEVMLRGEIIDGKWWTADGLKWREGFNALEEGNNPQAEERPDSN